MNSIYTVGRLVNPEKLAYNCSRAYYISTSPQNICFVIDWISAFTACNITSSKARCNLHSPTRAGISKPQAFQSVSPLRNAKQIVFFVKRIVHRKSVYR